MDEGLEGSLDLNLANVKLDFTGMGTYVRDPLKLGEEVEFLVRGFVRKTGTEWIEKDESEREFAQVKVTSIVPK